MTPLEIEVAVILSQDAIGQLADQIEQAYLRRHPSWTSAGVTRGVWETAAARLSEGSRRDRTIPIDPVLYVAVQAGSGGRPDPWSDLTQEQSLRRYLGTIRKIVGQLRRELRREVRRAEVQMGRGLTLDQLLIAETGRISPLSLYILAHRAGRPDLSMRLRADVEGQHRSCPLYRQASRPLLPPHAYPYNESIVSGRHDSEILAFSVN